MLLLSIYVNIISYGISRFLSGKELRNGGGAGSIPGSGRSPRGGNGKPLQYSCQENPVGVSLMVLSPRSCKELDVTEQMNTTTAICIHLCFSHIVLSEVNSVI